jgi:hypothetical protein
MTRLLREVELVKGPHSKVGLVSCSGNWFCLCKLWKSLIYSLKLLGHDTKST